LYISHMQDVRSVSSFFYISKLLSWRVIFCVCSVVSLPFFSGFFSKHYIIGLSLKTFNNLFVMRFLVFYVYLSGFYGWRLVSFITTQKNFYFSLNFNNEVFSRNFKLILLGIFRFIFLGNSLYFSQESFDFYSFVFFIFGFFGAYNGFYHYKFLEIFPLFIKKFYGFLLNVGSISPVVIN
jgi:formate hydrogenlyase subunit 3/multisubunit Na+/H+ antiporter MnhD subunit